MRAGGPRRAATCLPAAPLERARGARGSSSSRGRRDGRLAIDPVRGFRERVPRGRGRDGRRDPRRPRPRRVPTRALRAMREDGDGSGGDCPVPEEYRGKHGIFNVYNQRIDVGASGAPVSSAPPPPPRLRRLADGSAVGSARAPVPPLRTPPPCRHRPAKQHARGGAPGHGPGSAAPSPPTAKSPPSPSPAPTAPGSTLPQMFYNSLVRKGKAEDCTRRHVCRRQRAQQHERGHVATHHHVGATPPGRVSQPHAPPFPRPTDDLSPLAWTRYLLTGQKPFDRHDWYVDRNGKQVRYVIDYYFNEDKAGTRDSSTSSCARRRTTRPACWTA